MLWDPVLEETIGLLKTAKNAHISILATILHPQLKQALKESLNRGLNLEIFTNSKDAHATVAPLPFSVGWYAGLHDLDELLGLGAIGYGAIQFPDRKDSYHFLHRKLAIIDDAVIFGSHNLTIASTVTQDEMSFEIVSPDFAARMRRLSNESIRRNSVRLDAEEIAVESANTPIRQWFSSLMDKLYLETE
jgi:phosphatidylserine/phosphatidylglycerophosphate/cardiolipin synthase-like enzyme